MKLTKTKKVVAEEIDIIPGTYYFESDEGMLCKIVLTEYDQDGLNYFYEEVSSWGNRFGIRVGKDTIFDGEELPYKFSAFIRRISGKEITEEEFEKEREETLKRLI